MTYTVAYKRVLNDAVGEQCNIYYYNDAGDLERLWSDNFSSERPVMLLWDREPLAGSDHGDDRLLQAHLTPLDWALAWSLRMIREGMGVPAIIIVDLTANGWRETWAWRMRHQLLADMPWVKLTAPVPTLYAGGTHGWTFGPHAPHPSLGIICQTGDNWNLQVPATQKSLLDKGRLSLDFLLRNWAGSLQASDDHHDINNIVGARILLKQAKSAEDHATDVGAIVPAFLQKAAWLRGQNGDGAQWEPREKKNSDLFVKDLYVSIYDDMYHAGWEEFLLKFVQNIDCGYDSQAKPDELIEFITIRAVFDQRDFYQNAYEGGNGRPEIIFLDFKLYGRDGRQRFIDDTRKLLEKARNVALVKNLAWTPIPLSELEALEGWLDQGALENEEQHEQALLLLPRLLALALPLTPIIMFSSTAKARIRDKLKDYRNIFTGFQKPNPLSDPASVQSAISALGNAVDRAMPMLRRRLQLGYVQAGWEAMEAKRPTDRPPKHFEIYMDESGGSPYIDKKSDEKRFSPLFSTAAIFQFSSLEDADDKCRRLNELATINNNKYVLKKGDKLTSEMLSEEVRKIRSIIGVEEKFDIVSIKCRNPSRSSSGLLSLSKFKDGRLDDAIYQNIVFFTFVYTKFFSENSTMSINLAERRFYERDESARSQYNQRFGLNVLGNEVKSYNHTSAFPLVRGWLRSWGRAYSQLAPRILALIAKSISTAEPTGPFAIDSGRSFHYIADWAAGFVAMDGHIDHSRTLQTLRPILRKHLFDRFFYSSMMAQNLDSLSDCLRLSVAPDRPQMSQAIITLCNAPLVKAVGGSALERIENSMPQEHLWLWAIHPHIAEASGNDLMAGL